MIILHKERRYESVSGRDDDAPDQVQAAPPERQDVQKIKIIIAKQRNGEVGYFNMGLRSRTVHFENWEEEY